MRITEPAKIVSTLVLNVLIKEMNVPHANKTMFYNLPLARTNVMMVTTTIKVIVLYVLMVVLHVNLILNALLVIKLIFLEKTFVFLVALQANIQVMEDVKNVILIVTLVIQMAVSFVIQAGI